LFLGRIAEHQNLKDIVVKLAREKGAKAREDRAGSAGVVAGAAEGGRVGSWRKLRERVRGNVGMQRGRTAPAGGYEFGAAKVGPGGAFRLDGLEPGSWYFTFEEPGRASTLIGPVELKKGEAAHPLTITPTPGATIEGRVENVPTAMLGHVWVIAFDDRIIRREVLARPDGSFRLEGLPPGRYGLKAGHDAYEDPHSLGALRRPEMEKYRKEILEQAEPWRGAVVVEGRAGGATRGVVLDFRPPEPLFQFDIEPAPK